MAAPDVEHFLDMLDALCFFCQAQDQIVILCAVKLLRLIGSGRIQQRAAEHRQMGDEVHAAQIVRCKIRLEVIPAQLFQISRENDFVTVDKICPGALEGLHNLKEGVGIQYIVMVQQGNKITVGQCEAAGRVGGDAAVFDALIHDGARHLLGQPALQPFVSIACIQQHQLPVGVGLPDNAVQHLIEKFCRGVVERHDDADLRPLQGGSALGLQLAAQRDVRPVPPVIVVQG